MTAALVATGLIVWALIGAAVLYLIGVALYVAICAAVLVCRCWAICVKKNPLRSWLRQWWEWVKHPPDAMQVRTSDGWETVYWPFLKAEEEW